MTYRKLLVANRGEIAIRVTRAAAELGIPTLAVHAEDDARSLHVQRADEARALKGRGPAAYLDAEQILAIAREHGCDAIHPGYGFLSENAAFATRCAEAGLTFVGPRPDTLALLGDKIRARALARQLGIPVLPGSAALRTPAEAQAFFDELGPGAALLLKAAHGGGGRGLRLVRERSELAEAFERCRSEAAAAFGDDAVYCERFIERARHVEVQILGDGSGEVAELGLRECSLQRRHQKLIEIAPVPMLAGALAERLQGAAVELARAVRYAGVGTCEFLLDTRRSDEPVFIEANPRLQVEHTVTELVTGVDLVQTQLQLAAGKSLAELGFARTGPVPRGYAIQLRVNMETMDAAGATRPAGGVISVFEPPSGPGVRVDTFGYAGYATSAAYDSLLAKLIVHSAAPSFGAALARARRALRELRIEGVATNAGLLRALLEREELASGAVYTRFIEEHAAELFAASGGNGRPASLLAGARVDANDPLAVLAHGKSAADVAGPEAIETDVPEGLSAVRAPMLGTIVSLAIEEGQSVSSGQALLVMEAMKMESVIHAAESGVVRQLGVAPGDTVAFVLPNSVETVVMFLAASAVGTVAPLNPAY